MAKATISAGVCGFVTTVTAVSEDGQNTRLTITSDCPNYKDLGRELTQADAYEVCFAKAGEGKIYETCRKYCKHASCPVPAGIVKAVEAACGLALPRDAAIKVEK